MPHSKIVVLAFGNPQRSASTIYRIAQYEQLFNQQQATIQYITKKNIGYHSLWNIRNADVVINQKCFINTWLGRAIARTAKRLVLDFDDATWARPKKAFHPIKLWQIEYRLKWWANASDHVIAANSYLAQHLKNSKNISVIPMSLDLQLWSPCDQEISSKQGIVMGWAGSPVSFPYLEAIAPALRIALEKNPRLRLAIYSGQRPKLNVPFEYVPFKRGTEHTFVRTLDIGLLPLADDESARGKSPMKAIQYLACAVPVVGNRVGATADILTPSNSIQASAPEQWVQAIDLLVCDKTLRTKMGLAGREKAENCFDYHKVGKQFVQLVLPNVEYANHP